MPTKKKQRKRRDPYSHSAKHRKAGAHGVVKKGRNRTRNILVEHLSRDDVKALVFPFLYGRDLSGNYIDQKDSE